MRMWSTEMQVLNQYTKKLHWVEGMVVKSPTREMAQKLLDKYDYHYLVLGDEIICDIPCKPGTNEPDWNRMVDHQAIREN